MSKLSVSLDYEWRFGDPFAYSGESLTHLIMHHDEHPIASKDHDKYLKRFNINSALLFHFLKKEKQNMLEFEYRNSNNINKVMNHMFPNYVLSNSEKKVICDFKNLFESFPIGTQRVKDSVGFINIMKENVQILLKANQNKFNMILEDIGYIK